MMMTLKEISSGMPEAGEAGEMKRSALTAVLREEDGVYVSECPELGVATCGDTPEEALVNPGGGGGGGVPGERKRTRSRW